MPAPTVPPHAPAGPLVSLARGRAPGNFGAPKELLGVMDMLLSV